MSRPNKFKHTIQSVNKIISEIIEENLRDETIGQQIQKQKNNFNAKRKPTISIEAYLERIAKYTNIEETTLVLALMYIDLIYNRKSVILTDLNIHRLLFISILCGIKFNEDFCYTNAYYAKIAGVTLQELNELEVDFLTLLDFSLFVKPEMFCKYYKHLKHYRVRRNIYN
jgi:hypothetical protein